MAKGSKGDKQGMVIGMFSKIAREANRLDKKRIREAKRKGEFYYIENPELLSIFEQEKYYKAKNKFENGGEAWAIKYSQSDKNFPFPYKFAMAKDK
jgi:hypothetical protein